MKLEPVQSSNIAAIGHDPEKNQLVVQFKSGATHAYEGVSAEDHAALIGAESVGKHFHANIRNRFESSKYDGEVES
jgi:hypothetical protein